MSADYRMRRIRNIIKKIGSKQSATVGDLASALDAIRMEVENYETVRLRKKKEMEE